MSTHGSTFELTSTRAPAGSGHRPDVGYPQPVAGLVGGAVNTDEPFPQPSPIPLSGYIPFMPVLNVRAQPITENATDLLMLEADPNQISVQVDGALTANTNSFCLIDNNANNAFTSRGRLTPGIRLRTGADVQTAVNALVGTVSSWGVQVTYGYNNQNGYTGLAHIAGFETTPPATGSASSNAQMILNQLADGGSRTSLGLVAGSSVYVNNCALAGIAPEGAVVIRPEDIGNGDGQIPQAVGSNQAASFGFHPSVFVRRSQYWNSVIRRAYDTVDIAQTQQGQPLQIVQVNADPLASNWLFQIDGQMILATVTHPVGSDLRRPRDIWNQVIVPLIDGSSGARGATIIGIPGSSQGSVGVLSKMAYLEYARCLPIAGSVVVQDDTSPPG